MGRRLPWKTTDSSPAHIKDEVPGSVASPAPIAHRSTPARPRRVAETLSDGGRTPSTSPPPEPPREQFMIDGDERYRMVEDEFLHTAQRFTAHLHRAEYDRLRALAESQNAATILAMERPVVGPARTQVAKRRQGTNLGDEGSSGAPPSWTSTGLRGLLESPKKETRRIRRSHPITTPGTRAAAGFNSRARSPAQAPSSSPSSARQPPSDLRGGDDELLTRPGGTWSRESTHVQPIYASSARPKGNHQPAEAGGSAPKGMSRHRSEPNLKRTPQHGRLHMQVSDSEDEQEEDDDDDMFGIRKRRRRREKSRDQVLRSNEKPSRKASPDAIPTFL